MRRMKLAFREDNWLKLGIALNTVVQVEFSPGLLAERESHPQTTWVPRDFPSWLCKGVES